MKTFDEVLTAFFVGGMVVCLLVNAIVGTIGFFLGDRGAGAWVGLILGALIVLLIFLVVGARVMGRLRKGVKL